jgi:hypothetical protein
MVDPTNHEEVVAHATPYPLRYRVEKRWRFMGPIPNSDVSLSPHPPGWICVRAMPTTQIRECTWGNG